MCAIMQLPPIFLTAELFTCTHVLIVGFCLSVTDFVLDIEENLRRLNKNIAGDKNKKLTIKEQTELRKNIFDIIEFHSEAKELSKNQFDS